MLYFTYYLFRTSLYVQIDTKRKLQVLMLYITVYLVIYYVYYITVYYGYTEHYMIYSVDVWYLYF